LQKRCFLIVLFNAELSNIRTFLLTKNDF